MPKTPSRDDRARLSVLLRGGWAVPGDGGSAGIAVHPDVRFLSGSTRASAAPTRPRPRSMCPAGVAPLPWLTDTATALKAP